MSSFKKSIGSQSTLREFNVGEPETEPDIRELDINRLPQGYELSFEEREEINRRRQEADKKVNKPNDYARKRIEILADIGRLTKDTTVDTIAFSLRTLKSKENRDATMSVFDCKNDTDAAYELRRQRLARSIYQIDGQDVELTLGGDSFQLKLDMIDEMEETIINKLYNVFNELLQESRVKYGLETEEQVKEVLQDLKK